VHLPIMLASLHEDMERFYFSQRKISDSRCNDPVYLGLETSHIAKLTAFHHKCARWLVNVTRWDCRFRHITIKSILHDLELPTMEQIIHVRILRFLEKVAHMPGGRLTREVLRSHARPVGAIKRGPNKEMSTR
jgi:hypothetical protein